ncbi:ATP-binding cassette domain-containing protein [Sulfurivirga sp.]|uniref:ATP-binding cassette domain-containing protein n=1 Tax=Sulfurivirga sp. TaxID=2614236 RepID=UPI0025FAA94F|nr:ATP-binding cassette domain-containing protein [Sulfurivirga sp.]
MIRLEGVHKRYGRTVALEDVSLEVPRGQLFGLIGPDGAGKSTLMHIVAGVLAQDAGTVVVNGVHVDSERSAERIKSSLGLMPQGLGLNLYPTLSVEENLDFFAGLRNVPKAVARQRKTQLLQMTGLTPFRDRAMQHLSGGMQQKLGLICALIHEPELVILDEPTTGVDPLSRRSFWRLLAQLVEERGMTALVSTAYMDEAALFDQVALMQRGRVLSVGAPQALTDRLPFEQAIIRVRNPESWQTALAEHWPDWTRWFEGHHLHLQVPKAQRAAFEAWIKSDAPSMEGIWWQPADLEGLFLQAQQVHKETVIDLPPPRAERAIVAENLTRRFGRFTAVDEVSLDVHAGEIVGLLGANGAGKSTLMRMLTGLLPPTSGTAEVAGVSIRGNSLAVRRRIGYMAQRFSLYEELTVRENLRLFGRIYGLWGGRLRERLDWALNWSGLDSVADSRAGALPLGQRQRLALSAALLHGPSILFLDEPTSGVDPAGRRHFWSLLRQLCHDEGVAMLVSTHAMNEAENCHRVVMMRQGHKIADAPPDVLKQQLRERRGELATLQVDRPWQAERVLLDAGLDAFVQGRQVALFVHGEAEVSGRVLPLLRQEGLEVRGWQLMPPTMEAVFVSLIEGVA